MNLLIGLIENFRFGILPFFLLMCLCEIFPQNSSDNFETYKRAQDQAFQNNKKNQDQHFKQYLEDRKAWNQMLLGKVVDEEVVDKIPTYVDTVSSLEKDLSVIETKNVTVNPEYNKEAQLEEREGQKEEPVTINNKAVAVQEKASEKIATSGVKPENQLDANTQSCIPSTCPIDGSYRVSSPFGWRIHPIFHKRKFHYGIDLACPSGTPIKASADGVITYAGFNGSYGNYIVVKHANGYKSAYAHLSYIGVHVGQQVTKNTRIGRVGSTGRSTGPHLHYEVISNNKKVDPKKYFG